MKKLIVLIVLLIIAGFGLSQLDTKNKETETIVLGASLPLTGQAAHYGESSKKGIELALEIAKEKYPKTVVEVYFDDNQFSPKVAVDTYNNLRTQHAVDAIVVQTSPAAVAISSLSNKDTIPLMAVSASADTYRSADDLTFRTTGGTQDEIGPMVEFINSKYKNIGLLYMNNEIGVSIANALRNELKDTSTTITVDEGFALDAASFNANILKLKQNNVEAVYVAGLASHIGNYLKQANDLGYNVQVLTFRTAEDPTLVNVAGGLADGVIFTSGFDDTRTEESVTSFIEAYKAKYNAAPDNYAAESYAGTMWLVEAFDECGKDSQCIFKHLSTLKDEPSVFGNVSFDSNGDIFYKFILKTVKDGAFVKY